MSEFRDPKIFEPTAAVMDLVRRCIYSHREILMVEGKLGFVRMDLIDREEGQHLFGDQEVFEVRFHTRTGYRVSCLRTSQLDEACFYFEHLVKAYCPDADPSNQALKNALETLAPR